MPVLVFIFSAAFVLYVLIGYPLLLAAWARGHARPIRKEFFPRRVTVIVPVRNGAAWIESKLQSLLESDYPGGLLDILIVSDGSTDATNQLVAAYPDSRVRLLALAGGGKASAVSAAFPHVEGEILVLTDVRQSFHPAAIRHLVSCFADASVGVVTGELVIREGKSEEEYNTGLYWKYEKWIRRHLNRIDAMLGATGSIYAIRRELAVPMPAEILLDDVYLPFTAAFKGHRIYFEDLAKAYDLPTSLNSEFWRKVRTQAGVYQIVQRFPALLSPFNRRFIHFLSHKMGRLLLPFGMLAVALCSFWLPEPWRVLFLSLQGIFYGLAIVDPVIPEGSPVKRISAVTRAFVVLVAAAGCALTVFIRPARSLWRETQVSAAQGK
jgi:cellulose synthase/poly-beta-1,6-N-acetylglucosamine synthase-like glycosyltransferase